MFFTASSTPLPKCLQNLDSRDVEKLKTEGRKEGLFIVSESRDSDTKCKGIENKMEKLCVEYDCN